jgi:molybdopterin-guanine dinucleotide biosynthesis protein A
MTTHLIPTQRAITLGILAGGEASRLGGRDKAWLERDGKPQVMHLVDALASQVDAVMVSANRNAERYLAHGLRAVHDRIDGIGPIGGVHALATECRSAWLLTVPVDAVTIPANLIESLSRVDADPGTGAFAEDDDGAQPLLALWRVDALRVACAHAVASGEHAVHALQSRLGMAPVRFDALRIGNLNTPHDLAVAGIDPS